MVFKERLRELRIEANLTQAELAERAGVSTRTIQNYELGTRKPVHMEMVQKLAAALGTTTEYLLSENEAFVAQASEQYGRRGMMQAKELIDGMSGLFAGGSLSDEDKDAVMKALQDIYWESKARNVDKYTPKKYKKGDADAED